MGKVAITMTLTMESPEVDIEKVKTELNEKFSPDDIREEPIGFGLVALKILIVREDSEGGDTDKFEEEFSAIEGVGSVRIEDVTLI